GKVSANRPMLTGPSPRRTCMRRLSPRSGDGCCAISSSGRSYASSLRRMAASEEVRRARHPGDAAGCQVIAAALGEGSPARGALQEPLLYEVGLVYVFDRVGLFAHGHGQRMQPDRTTIEA